MNQQDLFPDRPPQQSRITMGNRLLDILADLQFNAIPISKAEQTLKAHFHGLAFQSTGA